MNANQELCQKKIWNGSRRHTCNRPVKFAVTHIAYEDLGVPEETELLCGVHARHYKNYPHLVKEIKAL